MAFGRKLLNCMAITRYRHIALPYCDSSIVIFFNLFEVKTATQTIKKPCAQFPPKKPSEAIISTILSV
jgi:hypothetical protein